MKKRNSCRTKKKEGDKKKLKGTVKSQKKKNLCEKRKRESTQIEPENYETARREYRSETSFGKRRSS